MPCDVEDEAQFFTVNEDGTVTNDMTGTCLTLGKAAPGAPVCCLLVDACVNGGLCGLGQLTLASCGGDFADLQSFTWSDAN